MGSARSAAFLIHRELCETLGEFDEDLFMVYRTSLSCATSKSFWRYRQITGAAVVGVTVLFVLGVLIAVLLVPTERLASLQLRLLFDGAAENQYPNGTAFSPAEIVAAPVLTEAPPRSGP